MRNVRIDFSAHISVVARVEDGDDYLDRAAELAEDFLNGNPSIHPVWEIDDVGIEDAHADENAEVVEQKLL